MSSGAACNQELDIFTCTLQTCCREQGYVVYAPAIASNITYLVIFAVFFCIQTGLGLRYKTWGFLIGMSSGMILEVLGYGGRYALRSDPFNLSIFLLAFIPIGLGPAFMTGSIYLTLARVVNVYGPNFSYFKPRTYTVVFVTIDISSLIIQAVGGSLSAAAKTDQERQKGVNALIAGLTFQACSLAGFILMSAKFAYNVRKGNKEDRSPEFAELRATKMFKGFVWAVSVAAMAIFVRCVYRVVELEAGFDGPIANNESLFVALEGPMIMFATLLMSIWHPGVVFRHQWKAADWHFRTKTNNTSEDEKVAELESDPE